MTIRPHNDWEILWLVDKNDPYFDLIVLRPLNANLVFFHMPSPLLPMPIMKPNLAETLFYACDAEKTVVPRQSGQKLVHEPICAAGVDNLWSMFFQIIPPEEIVALVWHNFTRPCADLIVHEIWRRAEKLFDVTATWLEVLPIRISF